MTYTGTAAVAARLACGFFPTSSPAVARGIASCLPLLAMPPNWAPGPSGSAIDKGDGQR